MIFVETNAFHTAVREHCNASNVNGLGPVSVLGHCRAATDGAPSVYENNHPIRSGGIVGTHNGIISNTNALFSYWINKYPDIKRSVYNRYSANFFLTKNKSLKETDVSYNEEKQIVSLIEKYKFISHGRIKTDYRDLYIFWRTSLDTLETMVNGKMYYWIRN